MPTWVKIVLVAVLGGFLLLATGMIFAGRWLRERFDSFIDDTVAVQDEGQKFGEGKDAETCTVESLERLRRCRSFACEPQVMLFLSNCLQTATTPPGYCEEIQKRTAEEECRRRGWGENVRCASLLSTLHAHCEEAVQ